MRSDKQFSWHCRIERNFSICKFLSLERLKDPICMLLSLQSCKRTLRNANITIRSDFTLISTAFCLLKFSPRLISAFNMQTLSWKSLHAFTALTRFIKFVETIWGSWKLLWFLTLRERALRNASKTLKLCISLHKSFISQFQRFQWSRNNSNNVVNRIKYDVVGALTSHFSGKSLRLNNFSLISQTEKFASDSIWRRFTARAAEKDQVSDWSLLTRLRSTCVRCSKNFKYAKAKTASY